MKHLQKKLFLLLIIFIFFLLSLLYCEKQTTPVENKTPNISLAVDEVAVTEAWLNLNMENMLDKDVLRVYRDDSVIYTGKPETADTTLYDNGLLPAHSYSYHASLTRNNQVISESKPQSITTMDTTSHQFSWETFSFGGLGSSLLYDVAIINESDIWAVGEIYADSAQPSKLYNAVHWEGQQWELKRIKTNACGGVDYPAIRAVFAFSSVEVLFAHIDGSITYFDGNNFVNDCSLITQLNGSVRQMWGVTGNDLYVVSGNGFIAHYNGSSWQKLESGTDFDFQDIWGVVDSTNGQNQILAVACNRFTNDGSAVVQITGNTINLVQGTGLPSNISGVWSADGREWYICGDGLFKSRDLSKPWQKIADQPLIYKLCIRGNGPNDIFVAGYLGLVSHWNGYSWHTYPQMPGHYPALAVQGDLVVAVGQETAGWVGGPAAILMGRRN
jgi:hypothetical protein